MRTGALRRRAGGCFGEQRRRDPDRPELQLQRHRPQRRGFRPGQSGRHRSISDRGLDFIFGARSHPILDNYRLVTDPGVLDIVHLGNRNTVDGGRWAFDPEPDGDSIGIQPNWLPDPDQTGPQTTTLSPPILLNVNSVAGIIFQISNGGGSFDVRFGFRSGADSVATLLGPDWFGPFMGQPNIGEFFGTQDNDMAVPGQNLLLTEGIVDLSAQAGRELVAISFANRTNTRGGYAIIAANVEGALGGGCRGDLNGDGFTDLADLGILLADFGCAP